jgi:hypothetical protein
MEPITLGTNEGTPEEIAAAEELILEAIVEMAITDLVIDDLMENQED